MLVYTCEGQNIEDQDVIRIEDSFYIVWYRMDIFSFVLYPLGGHSLPIQHLDILKTYDWEYLGHVYDEGAYEQIPMTGPSDNHLTNIRSYLGAIQL